MLHNIVDCFRKILVNGQVDVCSRLGLFPFQDGNYLTGIIYHHFFTALDTLQSGLHIGLNAAFSYDIIDGIGILASALCHHLFIQIRQFIGRNFAGITEYMCEILAVYVMSHRIFHNGNTV